MAKEKASIRVPVGDKVFRVISYVICIAFALACLYPLLLVLAVSFSQEYYIGVASSIPSSISPSKSI